MRMLSSWSSVKPLLINPRSTSSLRQLRATAHAYSNPNSDSDDFSEPSPARPSNYSGVKIEEKVELDSGKLRLDSWIASRINGISRARVQFSIRSGLVSVNGRVINKASHMVRLGDVVDCTIAELQPLRAEPEDIPLDIVYEDEHVIVVNKPAHLVVHPAPGNATGTLVNGILHHCRLSTVSFNPESLPEVDDDSGDEISALSLDGGIGFGLPEASVRPGIVHRLDKGTSGLLVIAKDEHSYSHLSEQFKKRNIKRVYVSLTCGVPTPHSRRVDVPVGRDVNNRIRMVATPGSATQGRARHAVSSWNMSSILNSKASFHSNPLNPISDCNDTYRPSLGQKNIFSGIKTEDTIQLNSRKSVLDYCGSENIDMSSEDTARSRTYPDPLQLLSGSTRLSLSHAKQIHAQLLRTSLYDSPHYRTKLLLHYSKHVQFSDSKNLLHCLRLDLFSFTTLINASSKDNDFKTTLHLFHQMLIAGLYPDSHLLPSVVKACAGLLTPRIGKQVHGFSLASGLSWDPFVESSLIHFYIKCDDLVSAHKVFNNMVGSDVVSWSALAAGYARIGDVVNAKKVFNEVQNLGFEPNIVSWNGMIAGFNQSGCFLQAVSMFQQMHYHGVTPDGTGISSVLPAVGDLGYLNAGRQVHGLVIKTGFGVDKCIVSALIDMYSKCGCPQEMLQAFEDTDQVDVGACNALIAGLTRHGLVDKALLVFKEHRANGMELNVVSWTSVIACCSQHGKDIEALELFREMQAAGVKPNAVTIPCLLPACGNITALMHGKAAHCFSIRRYITDDVYVASALIDMYANCGKIKEARCCFDRMPARNLVCWNAMLGGYAMHGKAKEAIEIFSWLQKSGQKPDSVSFTSLLSACSQSGLTEEGYHYFESMSKDHGVEPTIEHYACIVSLLGRAGKLEEAYSLITKMPYDPDACVWGALLSSCRLHHNMSLGEVAAAKLFELEPVNPGNYILLSNIYASKGKWKDVDKVRDIMREKGLKKNPGCSWIEVKNKVHMILAGDKSLPQMAEILDRLAKFSAEMKRAGCLPKTDWVLQDVEEQEKEHILCGHSEKLAVIFGILNTAEGSSLRVTKNLRICGDCHAVIKFISRSERREIFVRDTNRYHHFKDGECSCQDYW
ncbi:pentatricopeptide repeat-containing protein At1g20230-like [Salvia splendens]|uniref:pentatricopeptide repeat-containing protein At1g20230-like n=1 Tax=Salvia splendens TaxID=180675 RepID=UPI001101BBD0|nr:pentatricopeptide repeat-containing protein At1g20230-like [Salvia splendens]XP_042063097.1 pentatricopeptide repeat-containing protein At1g20230-like [Salvia splendens]XP_042063105.1 pentatricopeptide repeat-containing protein At1g20230-like [Salvia splendens]XP_042063114.1 pentatricopeptide repeat-containing protein At1g20230-like [Salvia splendens]